MHEGGEAYLTALADDNAHRLACFVHRVDEFEQTALSSVEHKLNRLGLVRVLVLYIEELGRAVLEIVAAACLDNLTFEKVHVLVVPLESEQPKVLVCASVYLNEVADNRLFHAIERDEPLMYSQIRYVKLDTFTRIAADTGYRVVLGNQFVMSPVIFPKDFTDPFLRIVLSVVYRAVVL